MYGCGRTAIFFLASASAARMICFALLIKDTPLTVESYILTVLILT